MSQPVKAALTDFVKRTMKYTQKIVNRINKTEKNKTSLKKCNRFCKKDYMVEMNKTRKKLAKQMNFPYKKPTKELEHFNYNICKKAFCNKKCIGYDKFLKMISKIDKHAFTNFKKNTKTGFHTSYGKPKIDILKQKGALSACAFDEEYDVYHT